MIIDKESQLNKTNKRIQQDCQTQDQLLKANSLFPHQQTPTIKHIKENTMPFIVATKAILRNWFIKK